jgi:photosystem II stability/assembly factor-like uncharacterized protein
MAYTIRAVKFLNAMAGFIAGDNGSLYKTENGGQSWNRIPLPAANNINSMFLVGENLLILVGDNGTVLRSVDLFTFELILSTEQASDDLLSVFFYDISVGWACGKNGVYLRTLDGGVSWKRYAISTPDPVNPLKERRVTEQLNSLQFVNLSDGWIVGNNGLILRTTDGGLRWADVSVSIYDEATTSYSGTTNHLNKIEVVHSYPVRISLSIFNSNRFRSAYYVIGPQYLDLYYQRVDNLSENRTRLTLAQYATDVELVTAINAIQSVDGYRVYSASLSYSETNYITHANTDKIYGAESTEIKFSMGDVAWIVGAGGTVLYTQNGGARWVAVDAKVSFDMYGISFIDTATGWIVGAEGEISGYLASRVSSQWQGQDTNLVKQIQRKVYANGNFGTPATLNLTNDSIIPDVKVETSARTQIQYRLRVVEGIDIQNFRDSGLGAPYVFSRGPNDSVLSGGSYSYENMGPINGDYGVWRALCRNTVDGYTYAVPMFVISRRNQQPYNAITNVNGSSVDALNAIRPDGLIYEDIIASDVLDVRRKISSVSTSELLGRTFDNLLAGKLATSMVSSPLRGGQVGSMHMYVDEVATSAITAMLNGEFNTEAVPGMTSFAGGSADGIPGVSGFSPTGANFTTLVNGMYHHSPYYYSATYRSTNTNTTGSLDGQPIPGFFTGMGTEQATFVFYGESGIQESDVSYVIQGAYIDYSKQALSRTPAQPLQVKNYVNGTPNLSVNYNGIQKDIKSQLVRQLSTGVQGLTDYVEMSAIGFGDSETICASKVRLHSFQEITKNTTTIKLPKNNEGFFVFGIHEIRNTKDGGVYRMLNIMPNDGSDDSVMVAQLASNFTVVEGSIIEIISEVTTQDDSTTTFNSMSYSVGMYSQDKGESIDATRNPFVAVFDSTIRGVDSLFKSLVVKIAPTSSKYFLPSNTVGIATMPRLEGAHVPYAWSVNGGDTAAAVTVPVAVTYNTDGTLEAFSPMEPLATGILLVSILVKEQSFLPNTGSGVSVSYKVQAPQTLYPLPTSLNVVVLECGKDMVISPLGNGGGLRNSYFPCPLEQIPTFDNVSNQSFFFNLFGLEYQNFFEADGHLTMPMRVSRHPGGVITLANPGVDSLGRTFYSTSSENMIFTSESLTLGNPRKMMVPMLVKVASSLQSPVLKGEVLLAIATTYDNTTLANKIQLGSTAGRSIISLYKVPGMPILK